MPRSSVTVLAYHRIAPPGGRDLSPALIDAYPADFEAQMRYVAKNYNVVSGPDIVRALREDYTLPRRALAITFDDGYTCFRDAAMPILRRLGLPATLFVPTAFTSSPGRLFWWDDIYRALSSTSLKEIEIAGLGRLCLQGEQKRMAAYEQAVGYIERSGEEEAEKTACHIVEQCGLEPNKVPYLLGWDDVEALAAEGVAIGPHTRLHTILSRVAPKRASEEVDGSWADLQAHLAKPLPIFCYPNGQPHAVNAAATRAACKAGLAGGVTMVPGLNVLGKTDPFRLHRLGATAGESLAHFRVKISPAGRVYRRLKALRSA